MQNQMQLDFLDVDKLQASALDLEKADVMVENVIGTFALPLAVAVNFTHNGRDILVPMVVEEPSVLAAVSNMSRLVRAHGGFTTDSDASIMIGQIQISPVRDVSQTMQILQDNKQQLLEHCAGLHKKLEERGGGLVDLYTRHVVYDEPGEDRVDMVVLHFELNCVDAMGANMVNTVAEHLAPLVEDLTKETVNLCILSNYATKRLARAHCSIPFHALIEKSQHQEHTARYEQGKQVAMAIVDAYRFAYADPWRAATHNKGIMNGIDPVVIATGNDWRAIEAGAHAWASRTGQYRSMSKWWIENDHVHGKLELPMQIGTVGGCIRNHPQVAHNLQILGNPRAQELSEIMVAVGLAQNLGAIKALATEGIQKGHMRMHARNMAVEVGATAEELPKVVEYLCAQAHFSTSTAMEALENIRAI